MAVVSFVNIKGGSGKTTAATVFASQVFTVPGARVVMFEGDPNRPLATWAAARGMPVIEGDRRIDSQEAAAEAIAAATQGRAGEDAPRWIVIHDPDEERTFHWLEAAQAWAHFVVADPEGSPNEWLNAVASHSDLVVVPFAPTALDTQQVARTVQVLARIGKLSKGEVPFRVLLTKTAAGAVQTRDEKDIRRMLKTTGLPMLETSLQERPAFRAVFKSNKTVQELRQEDASEEGLEKARANAARFTEEILAILQETMPASAAAAA